eukprot:403354222
MGWNSWNKFYCDVSETLIKQTADKLVELGLDKLGYNYVNVDDCWMEANRDSKGHMVPDRKNFPNGMKAVAEYIHEKRLLFGLYSSAGTMTCQKRAGSLNHEDIDAQDFADWQVDYLKYDNCYNENVPAIKRYTKMRDALIQTARPIFYSICNWGDEDTPSWAPEVGNSWRTTLDIEMNWQTIERNIEQNNRRADVAGPGGWNDPDMMEIGNGVLNHEQEKTHFALWAAVKAPLIIGCDLAKIDKKSLEILKNQQLIDINQDPLGVQAKCVQNCAKKNDRIAVQQNIQVFAGPLENGDTVVIIVNWNNKPKALTNIKLDQIGLSGKIQYKVMDLWTGKYLPNLVFRDHFINFIKSYDNVALRFTPVDVERENQKKKEEEERMREELEKHKKEYEKKKFEDDIRKETDDEGQDQNPFIDWEPENASDEKVFLQL